MDKIKLSHSKAQKYLFCPKQYELYYEKKIRSKVLGSPLFFGLACDEAINRMLLDLKEGDFTDSEKKLYQKTPMEVFDYNMKNAIVNSQRVKVLDYKHLQFSKADFDISLLTDEDIVSLGQDKTYWSSFVEWYYLESKSKTPNIKLQDTLDFNRVNWISLYRKGEMIIDSYFKEVIPKIHKVYSIQKPVKLPNEHGDEIIGFIDFICSFIDDIGTKYIVDNKSSSKPYKDKDLEESDQLHTYAESEGISNICYIVYEKLIRKKEPRVRITIMKGKIKEEHTEKVFDNYEKVLDGIKEKKFNTNYDSGCFEFGRKCIYYDICHHGKMGDGLITLKKENIER